VSSSRRRTVQSACVAVLIFALAACGNTTTEESPRPPSAQPSIDRFQQWSTGAAVNSSLLEWVQPHFRDSDVQVLNKKPLPNKYQYLYDFITPHGVKCIVLIGIDDPSATSYAIRVALRYPESEPNRETLLPGGLDGVYVRNHSELSHWLGEANTVCA